MTLVACSKNYEARLLSLDKVWIKDDQYAMNYVIFNKMQERAEVFLPSQAAVLNSVIQLETQLTHLLEAMVAISEDTAPMISDFDVSAYLKKFTKGSDDVH